MTFERVGRHAGAPARNARQPCRERRGGKPSQPCFLRQIGIDRRRLPAPSALGACYIPADPQTLPGSFNE